MSSYSSNLRIELITTGTQAGTWGTTTNDNLSTVLEQAIAGNVSITTSASSQALTYLNGPTSTSSANQSVRAILTLNTSTGANFAVYAPPVSKLYTVKNASTYTATIYNSTVIGNTTAAGTGVSIPAGATVTIWSDGTNFAQQNTYLNSPTFVTPTLGTPASGALTNCTDFPVGSLGGLGVGVGAFLATPSSANLAAAVSDETGTGSLVFASSPTLTTPTIAGATMTNDLSLGANKLTTTNFKIYESGSKLIIANGSTVILSISSTGAVIAGGTVTGVGTP